MIYFVVSEGMMERIALSFWRLGKGVTSGVLFGFLDAS